MLSGNTGYDGFGANGVPQMWNVATNSWKTYVQAKLTHFQYPRTFQAPNGQVFEAGPGAIGAISILRATVAGRLARRHR